MIRNELIQGGIVVKDPKDYPREKGKPQPIGGYRPIYWYGWAYKAQITKEQWNDIVDLLEEKKFTYKDIQSKSRDHTSYMFYSKLDSGVYTFHHINEGRAIYISEWVGRPRLNEYYILECKNYDSKLQDEIEEETGEVKKGSELFIEANKTLQLTGTYGMIPYSTNKVAKTILMCCNDTLQPILYTNPSKYFNSHKADVSSAYPSKMYDMPDAKTAVIEKGIVEPDDEYRFCYYSDGNVCIKEKDGTYTDTRLFDSQYYHLKDSIYKTKGIHSTLKMKSSNDERLFEYMNDIYEKKSTTTNETDEMIYKATLNFLIGYMRSVDYNKICYMGHISAVAYARHVKSMLDYINDLEKHNCIIMTILTDSIIWTGKYQPFNKEKKLGNMVHEYDGIAYVRGQGQYVFTDNDGNLNEKSLHTQGYSKEIKSHINNVNDFYNIKDIAKQYKIREQDVFNKQTHKWIINGGNE